MQERVLRRGRVVDAQGTPVADALVAVVWGTAPTPEIGRRANADGLFQVALPPGQFRVQAVGPGGETGQVEIDGGDGDEIVIQVGEPGASSDRTS
jgi:hypothetical protein